MPGFVGEADIFKAHTAAEGGRARGVGRVADVRHPIQQIDEPLPGGGRFRQATGVFGEVLHRAVGRLEVSQENQEIPGADPAAQDQPCSLPQNQRRGYRDDHVHGTFQSGRKPFSFDVFFQAALAFTGEALGKCLFERERLNGFDGVDGFRGRGGHRAFLAALFLGHFTNAMREGDGAQPEQRKDRHRDEGELPVHVKHQPDHARDDQHLGQGRNQRGDGHVLQHADIADDPHHQVAGPGPGVEG